MKRNWILIVWSVLLLAVVSLLTLHLHYEGIQEVLSQFQEHQLSYAKHLSNQIQFFIQARSRGLKALASFASLQSNDASQQRKDIEAYAKQIGRVYVKEISLYNGSGTIVYSTDPNTIGLKKGEEGYFVWAQKSENRGKTLLTPVFIELQSLTFILVVPLYQEVSRSRNLKPDGRFAGVLTFTLDMKEFLANQLVSLDPKMNLDQVWIMDKDGTLLFQPDHPEMVFRNIYQREGSCRSCHLSFNYTEEILSKGQGAVDYKIRDHPKKIAAFASMEIENVSWVVVVNTPYDQVTGFIKKSLREHLILIGVVVIAFAISFALVIRKERMKIQAEEEVMRWQEKMDDRKKAEEVLQLERNKLKGILDSMDDGVYIVNQQNEILYINPVIERKFGPIKGRRCHEYFNELPEACSWCKNREVFTGIKVRWEWYHLKTGKTYDVVDAPITDPDGTLCKLEILRDISDRKKVERALRQSEQQYRMLVDTMNEGLGVQDENGVWAYVNNRLCEMLGYSREEILGRPLMSFLGKADQAVYKEQIARRRGGEIGTYELSWIKKDRQTILTLVSPKPIFSERGQYKGSFAVVTDITDRKRAEDALKDSERRLRSLSAQLLTAQETERKRISRELHDELGQSLTVLKLRLNFIEKNLLKNQTELRQECEIGVHNINRVIENVRRLSRDLSPTILEDFGLSAALRWLINNFAKNYNIIVHLNMMDIDSLVPQVSHVGVYRAVQEALTNVGKHARAKDVSITINRDSDQILLTIEDDGIGFNPGITALHNPEDKGLGLATMRGRAEMAGGVLKIWTEEGKGTRILMSFPIQRGET